MPLLNHKLEGPMSLAEALKRSELFSALDEEGLAELSASSRLRKYKKDGVILMQGDICEGLALVAKGEIAVEEYNPEGDANMVDLLGVGDCVGEELLFDNEARYPYTVLSCSATELYFISRNAVCSLLEKDPLFRQSYFRMLSSKLLKKYRHIVMLSQKSLRQKVGCFIRETGMFSESNEIILPASRELIAKYLAMPRPSFSRELTQMCRDGVLEVEGRRVRILDHRKLEQILIENGKDSPIEET